MKSKSAPIIAVQSNPQPMLEKILSAEVDAAERISAAKEKAEKLIISAQSEIEENKNKTLAEAHAKRDRVYDEGIKSTRQSAEKMIAEARAEAKKTISIGDQYQSEAVEEVMNFLIGKDEEPK